MGSVAECGVCMGDFSIFINKYFFDRKLYLFDTFSGFDKDDHSFEIELGEKSFVNGSFSNQSFFGDVEVKDVIRRMPKPDNCIIKKGYFPNTAIDVRDSFCFVNLDMDLCKPMLAGLRFFWDNMVSGGVILLHDYFHPELPGVKIAVEEFENEINKSVCKIPIGDSCSLALIKD